MSPVRCFIMLMTILVSASLKAVLSDIFGILLRVFVIENVCMSGVKGVRCGVA